MVNMVDSNKIQTTLEIFDFSMMEDLNREIVSYFGCYQRIPCGMVANSRQHLGLVVPQAANYFHQT